MKGSVAFSRRGWRFRGRVFSAVLLGGVFLTAAFVKPAHAFSLRTHVYVANVIMQDAQDGKVFIPPFGEFEVAPRALQAITNFPECFRAGAIGPDGFPDVFTGQMQAHPKIDPWLKHLWTSAEQYRSADNPFLSTEENAQVAQAAANQVWAFTYGFLIHCAGDMWAHDWVNYYAGGVWPSVGEIWDADLVEEARLLGIIARHLLMERAMNARVPPLSERTIDIPNEFVLNTLLVNRDALNLGLNPVMEYFVEKYFEKEPYKDDTIVGLPTYTAAWFEDLREGLSAWVDANENAMKETIEQDEWVVEAVVDNLVPWAVVHLLDMLGVPSVVKYGGEALVSAVEAVDAFIDFTGLREPVEEMKNNFVDYMLRTSTGMTKQQWKDWTQGEATEVMFGQSLKEILQEMGTVPEERNWVHDNSDHARFRQFMSSINGPLYNAVITGKLALLPPSELNRLTGSSEYSESDIDRKNVLLGVLDSIDDSRQYENLPWLGYGASFASLQGGPTSAIFPYIFKPYHPIDLGQQGLWSESGGPPWGSGLPVQLQARMFQPDGSGAADSYLLYRKASEMTGPWTVLAANAQGYVTQMFLLDPNEQYYFRPLHSRLNFGGSTRASPTYGDSILRLTLRASEKVPATEPAVEFVRPGATDEGTAAGAGVEFGGMEAAVGGVEDLFGVWGTGEAPPETSGGTEAWNVPSVEMPGEALTAMAPEVTVACDLSLPPEGTVFGTENNDIGLASSFPASLWSCRLRVLVLGKEAATDLWLTGVTGKLSVHWDESSITPSQWVQVDFTIDENGSAHWGCTDLVSVPETPREVTVYTGSHPGMLRLALQLNLTEAALAGARVAHAYQRVQNAFWNAGAVEDTPETEKLRQVLDNLPNTIQYPDSAEDDLRQAIAKLTDAQLRGQLQKALDDALREFPLPGGEEKLPGSGGVYSFFIQPGLLQADTDDTLPRFERASVLPPWQQILPGQ